MRSNALLALLGTLALAMAGCRSAPSPTDQCEDAPTEAACRECCQQVGTSGATWVDRECACLAAR